ncbi:MAG: hypothetical protein C4519_09445 [Desulfobacteraceae bacterium]|nr:MAG: hypothetical protein C4519_09445 [Desulfobacteraceae bacterium]
MKIALKVLILLGWVVIGVAVNGKALAFVFDMGAGSSIDTSATNAALRLDVVQMNPDLDDIFFDLDVGQTSGSFYFATIGTTESWINRDDLQPAGVTAFVDFDSPDLVQSIGGSSVGFSALWNFFQGWNLEWMDPVRIVTSSGIDFSVDLSDVNHFNWLWQGPDGTADIYATVTLNAVPVPPALLLLGSGLLGLLGLRRRIGF